MLCTQFNTARRDNTLVRVPYYQIILKKSSQGKIRVICVCVWGGGVANQYNIRIFDGLQSESFQSAIMCSSNVSTIT